MRYLIDGHNLIPKIAGLSLNDADDELKLITLLHEFCRLRRSQVSVFFDGALPGMSGTRVVGSLEVISVPRSGTADDAIRARLKKMKGAARNVTVVSSDHQVQRAAAVSGAAVMKSEEFADLISETTREGSAAPDARTRMAAAQDVEEWLKEFSQRGDDADEKSLR